MAIFGRDKEKKKNKSGKQCFISHCSDDRELILGLQKALSDTFVSGDYVFFNTSLEEHSSLAGEERSSMIKNALAESDLMIAVITDSYIRSTICISEISSFWYTGKTVIPFVYSEAAGQFLNKILGKDVIYVDAVGLNAVRYSDPEKCSLMARDRATKFMTTMESLGYVATDANKENGIKAFADVLINLNQVEATRPYIGSEDVYDSIMRYCYEYGILQFSNSSLAWDTLKARLSEFKDIYIVSTTGRSLIHSLSADFIPEILSKGANITVIIPNKYSDFVEDVAEIESLEHKEENSKRLADEFTGVMNALSRCIEAVKDVPADVRGHIYLACSYTLLRQTITLGVDDEKGWGWMSMTLPPKKTAEGTPSFEFQGSLRHDQSSMAKLVYGHIQAILDVARVRGEYFEFTPEMEQPKYFFLEEKSAKEMWNELYQEATRNTLMKDGDLELIEVAAQHPLNEDGTPGTEFALRLKEGARLYREILSKGGKAKIYVPGSVHLYEGIPDVKSLSQSGVDYLVNELQIPLEDILGPETNERFKGEDGVYNSADECYVASMIYKRGSYHRLHCVCSSSQMARKKMFYIAFGVIALFHTADADQRFHNDISEMIEGVPYVIYRDSTWQNHSSERFIKSREERRPKK